MLPPVPEFLPILVDNNRQGLCGVLTVSTIFCFSDLCSYSCSKSNVGARMSCKISRSKLKSVLVCIRTARYSSPIKSIPIHRDGLVLTLSAPRPIQSIVLGVDVSYSAGYILEQETGNPVQAECIRLRMDRALYTRFQRRVPYGTGTPTTGINVVLNLPKCPGLVFMLSRNCRSARYRYGSLYRYHRYRYPYPEVSGTGIDVVPNSPKCRVPV